MEEYNPNKAYCGAGWFMLQANHPFNYAGYLHDMHYYQWPVKPTKPIDIQFKADCELIVDNLQAAGAITWVRKQALQGQIWAFYGIVSIWGKFRYYNAKVRKYDTLLK